MARGTQRATSTSNGSRYSIAVARILIGLIFLWAFFDKLAGLKYSTLPAKSWLHGGSPTKGFLLGVKGPFADTFHSIAGQGWADWLFMIGLLGLGLALVFGIGLRIAAFAGSALLVLMWAASLPIKTNPVLDDHLVYAAVLWVVYFNSSNPALSIAGWWRQTPLGRSKWLQ